MGQQETLSPRTRQRPHRQLILGAIVLLMVTITTILSARVGRSSPPSVSPLTAGTVSSLAKQGITVKAVSDSGAVSTSSAVSAAQLAIPAVQGAGSSSLALVSFTDSDNGPVQSDGEVAPTYVDREAWVVTFHNIKVPLLGPPGTADGDYNADMLVFVDAQSGKYLEAIALATN